MDLHINTMPKDKKLIFLKGIAVGRRMTQSLRALHIAEIAHENQTRKDGDPYILHPVRVASTLVNLKIYDDATIAAAILHDVVEDCPDFSMASLQERFEIDPEVMNYVTILTKTDIMTDDEYYRIISKKMATTLIKISDRHHNLSTMVGAFSIEKILSYIQETKDFVFPLCKFGANYYTEYTDQIYTMKDHMKEMIYIIEGLVKYYEGLLGKPDEEV